MQLDDFKSRRLWLCLSYLYSGVIYLITGVTGACLCVWCGDSFSDDLDTFGLVKSSCLITGIVMMLFLVSWTVFVSLTVSSSLAITENESKSKCTRTARKRLDSSRNQRTCFVISGRVTMSLLVLCCLTQLTSLGFMWWASFSLADTFQVTENCFCRWRNTTKTFTTSKNVILNQLNLNVSCPEIEDLSCITVYQELSVVFKSLPVTIR